VFGNVGTLVVMRVGAADAEFLEKEFEPRFTMNDLVNLAKYTIYLKLMIDGASSEPFSANSLPPISKATGSYAKVIRASQERYAIKREVMEAKIMKFSEAMQGSMVQAKVAAKEAKNKNKKPKIVAKCTDCKKEFNPPFRPTGDRPVYCPDCYNLRKDGITPTAANHVHRAGEPIDAFDGGAVTPPAPKKSWAPTVGPGTDKPVPKRGSQSSTVNRSSQRSDGGAQRRERAARSGERQARPDRPVVSQPPTISISDALKNDTPPVRKERRSGDRRSDSSDSAVSTARVSEKPAGVRRDQSASSDKGGSSQPASISIADALKGSVPRKKKGDGRVKPSSEGSAHKSDGRDGGSRHEYGDSHKADDSQDDNKHGGSLQSGDVVKF